MQACATVEKVVENTRATFAAFIQAFHDTVIESHGDHIPLRVRDSVVVLFWLPEILRRCGDERDPVDAWTNARECMPVVLAYVENQLDMYAWPSTDECMTQYKNLMRVWSSLLSQPGVAEVVMSGAPCPVAGQVARKGHGFSWTAWWKLAHIDERFCPPGCEAVLALFHFTGMLGVSEAQAESVASFFNLYARKSQSCLAAERIIEKAEMRLSDVKGNGSDDVLLLRAWAELQGSSGLKFEYKARRNG